MKQNFVNYIYEFFNKLIELYDFKIKAELNEGQSYLIEYESKDFSIKIEKYFREFYVSLYKLDDLENEINLFNLLEYLKQGATDSPRSEYFHKEKDIEICYRNQLEYISTIIYNNFPAISSFFCSVTFKSNVLAFERYWENKHPELYKK